MERISVRDLSRNLSELMGRVVYGDERVVITRNGKDYAALISFDELQKLEDLEDFIDNLQADAALREAEEKGTIPFEKVRELLNL